MNRRDLKRWVEANNVGLAARGVRAHFGFAPSLDRGERPSWVSFVSASGSGRLVREADGSSRVDAHAFADGACLRHERHDDTSVEQLQALLDVLTVRAVVR